MREIFAHVAAQQTRLSALSAWPTIRAMQTRSAAETAPTGPEAADRDSRNAAIALATTLPSDVVLYLLF
uniref:hypothetical protein n=1 Tax=Raoultella terrigena TaxID=577 RepID=UPI001C6FDC13